MYVLTIPYKLHISLNRLCIERVYSVDSTYILCLGSTEYLYIYSVSFMQAIEPHSIIIYLIMFMQFGTCTSPYVVNCLFARFGLGHLERNEWTEITRFEISRVNILRKSFRLTISIGSFRGNPVWGGGVSRGKTNQLDGSHPYTSHSFMSLCITDTQIIIDTTFASFIQKGSDHIPDKSLKSEHGTQLTHNYRNCHVGR